MPPVEPVGIIPDHIRHTIHYRVITSYSIHYTKLYEGSYIGLLFLGGIYASIGLFASSLTENQIVAFILAVLLSFLSYLGFEMISGIAGSGSVAYFISRLGIDYHYAAISRGVVDTRDLVYFLSVMTLFILSARIVLQKRKWRNNFV